MGPIDRLRSICLALSDVTERLTHGQATWFMNDRWFATTADHHHEDRVAVCCAAPSRVQEALTESDPDRLPIALS